MNKEKKEKTVKDLTEIPATPKEPGKGKRVRMLVEFLETLAGKYPEAIAAIRAKISELDLLKAGKSKVASLLSNEQVAWTKMTFISEAAKIEGLSEGVIEAIAEAAAKKGVEDPDSTKLYKILNQLGAENAKVLFESWVVQLYKKLHK